MLLKLKKHIGDDCGPLDINESKNMLKKIIKVIAKFNLYEVAIFNMYKISTQ